MLDYPLVLLGILNVIFLETIPLNHSTLFVEVLPPLLIYAVFLEHKHFQVLLMHVEYVMEIMQLEIVLEHALEVNLQITKRCVASVLHKIVVDTAMDLIAWMSIALVVIRILLMHVTFVVEMTLAYAI